MSMSIKAVIATLYIFVHAHAQEAPKQGVFLLSNQPTNQIGVYESLSTGELVWQGRYDTGGVGYPDPIDNPFGAGLNNLGSSNAVHYHVWNNKQWLLAANAGGPGGTPSLSIFQVMADLTLVRTDVAPMMGIFACSAAGFGDRACAISCGGDVVLNCFRISTTGRLSVEFTHNFQAGFPASYPNRTNRALGPFGPGNLLFTPSGDGLAVVFKGTAFASTLGLSTAQLAALNSPASLQVFPVQPRTAPQPYGPPIVTPLQDSSFPFAVAFRPGATLESSVALIVNVAGQNSDFPGCIAAVPATCLASVTSVAVAPSAGANALRVLAEAALNVLFGCWIEYFDGYLYTGDFTSDSITIAPAAISGAQPSIRSVPAGRNSIVNDLARTGAKLDGSVFLYSENQGTMTIGVNRVLPDRSTLQVQRGAPVPSGRTQDAWVGNNGLTATGLTEAELFALYGYMQPTRGDNNRRRRIVIGVVVAAVLLLAGVLGGYWWWRRRQGAAKAAGQEAAQETVRSPLHTDPNRHSSMAGKDVESAVSGAESQV